MAGPGVGELRDKLAALEKRVKELELARPSDPRPGPEAGAGSMAVSGRNSHKVPARTTAKSGGFKPDELPPDMGALMSSRPDPVARFNAEVADGSGARQWDAIHRVFAQAPKLAGYYPDQVECRQTVCRIKVMVEPGADIDFGFIGRELMAAPDLDGVTSVVSAYNPGGELEIYIGTQRSEK